MFYGGSRSGKTFLHMRNTVLRALKAPKSRHVVLRYRFNHVKSSIVFDTFPKVLEICYPNVKYVLDKTNWFAKFQNGSEIWFGGLDDKERTEKILGNEYATIYLNECSEISDKSREIVTTRLAQKVYQIIADKKISLPLKMFYDCNPPLKSHWSYKLFIKKINPDSKQNLPNPENYGHIQMNPIDNLNNIAEGYMEELSAMSTRARKRFKDGEFGDDNPNALFSETIIDQNRLITGETPQLLRVIVAVDPSGAGDKDNENNDAIGIMVGGLGIDGRCYVLEDCTVKAGPGTWGKVAVNAYERHSADCIVAEKNYGGEMVWFTIQTAKQDVPFRYVTATRGKVVRAEPVSALYEAGKVVHVGYFQDLEDELFGFSTFGYIGDKSPNRADALVWLITELFPGMVAEQSKPKEPNNNYRMRSQNGWMC